MGVIMKILVKSLILALVISSAYATVLENCIIDAQEICQELRGTDFQKCFNEMLNQCLDDRNYLIDGVATDEDKVSACYDKCSNYTEPTMRHICYNECKK